MPSALTVCAELWARTALNQRDVMAFGPRFLLRHLPRLTGAYTAGVHISGVGRFHMRAGDSDVEVVRQIFLENQYQLRPAVEARVRARYDSIIGSGRKPIIVDAGANIGASSMWFRREYPAAAIVAVEPDPQNLRVLRMNAEGRGEIDVVPAAIGGREGFVKIEDYGSGWSTRTRRDECGVPIITMANAFARVTDGVPFIAKIDIEGFEDDLFAQNVDWLNEVYVVAIEPHDWLRPGERTSRSFQMVMGRLDFEIFISGDNLIYVRV